MILKYGWVVISAHKSGWWDDEVKMTGQRTSLYIVKNMRDVTIKTHVKDWGIIASLNADYMGFSSLNAD